MFCSLSHNMFTHLHTHWSFFSVINNLYLVRFASLLHFCFTSAAGVSGFRRGPTLAVDLQDSTVGCARRRRHSPDDDSTVSSDSRRGVCRQRRCWWNRVRPTDADAALTHGPDRRDGGLPPPRGRVSARVPAAVQRAPYWPLLIPPPTVASIYSVDSGTRSLLVFRLDGDWLLVLLVPNWRDSVSCQRCFLVGKLATGRILFEFSSCACSPVSCRGLNWRFALFCLYLYRSRFRRRRPPRRWPYLSRILGKDFLRVIAIGNSAPDRMYARWFDVDCWVANDGRRVMWVVGYDCSLMMVVWSESHAVSLVAIDRHCWRCRLQTNFENDKLVLGVFAVRWFPGSPACTVCLVCF